MSSFFITRLFCLQSSKRVINPSSWLTVTEQHIMQHTGLAFSEYFTNTPDSCVVRQIKWIMHPQFCPEQKIIPCKRGERHTRKLAKMQYTAFSFHFFLLPLTTSVWGLQPCECLPQILLILFSSPAVDTHNLISSSLATTRCHFFL